MSPRFQSKPRRTLASFELEDAYTDFLLSRQAMRCTEATMQFYRHTAAKFLAWAEKQGATSPKDITPRLIRQFMYGSPTQR